MIFSVVIYARITKILEKGTLTMSHDEAIMRQQTADSRQQTADSHEHSQKLRVLYVTNMDGTGGGASFSLCALMLDLKKRYNVEPVFFTRYDSEFTDLCRKNGIEVITQNYYAWAGENNLKSRIKLTAKKFLNRLLFVKRRILKRLDGRHFDIIHTNSSVTDMGDFISQHYSIPHVWHIRESGCFVYHYPEEYVRTLHARAAANIMISHANYDFYVNQRKICPPENTRVIYNGVKEPAEYEKRAPNPQHIHFCMTGAAWNSSKNQMMAVKACEKLKSLTSSFTLHLVGSSDNSYGENIKRFVHAHGLDDYVKFWGYHSGVDEILKDMDVGLMLSEREGFGRVTVEYMLHYMPVIGVNSGATPEIVLDGETGFLCTLNDTDTLAELMHRFITNPELIHTMGSKGRQRAVTHFSLERNTDEIYALYQEILSRH